MRHYRILLITSFVCAFSLTDCRLGKSVYTGIDLSDLSDYQTTFQIEFQGDYTWRYTLVTYHDGELTENNLHIEGVEPAQNPGDIRLVTDGQTSWMTGPGVDDECYMFPNDFDIGYSFLSPDDIFPPENISPLLAFESKDQRGGLKVKIYSANLLEYDGWNDFSIEMWLVDGGDYPNYYTTVAEGDDSLFDAGKGSFNSTFTVGDYPDYQIEPVIGCDIPFPLPEDADQVVRFPGLYSFESNSTLENMATFYKNYLMEDGWREDHPLTGIDTDMQMSYSKGKKIIVLYLKTIEDGVMVQILQQ